VNESPGAAGFGAQLQADGATAFGLWAPSLRNAAVVIERDGRIVRHAMARGADGFHRALVADAAAGTRYRYEVSSDLRVPDPASRHNPDDVHGSSAVTDPHRYRWQDTNWRGRPWHEAVIYELHVGTFTPQGTFAGVIGRLAELAQLGITAIELMPLAEFAGARNWGYDGVLPYAPDAAYGTPDELKELVDRAHALGLMVLLDVVYNHFGPDGNYLHAYCPEFFNPRHQTPWGPAINFDGAANGPVRQFFCENALYWVEEFHFDGLRLDAVHQIHDDSPRHIVSDIAAALHDGPGRSRQVHLVLENDASEASRLERARDGSPLVATAQWNDDLHHAAHVALSGEVDGYYEDFAADPVQRLARSLARGFVYQGQHSAHRGVPHGSFSGHLPPSAFISFLQNHDQIGNRALGERIGALADAQLLDAVYACLLLSPHAPMLFMGEEFAASTPFLYFCDFHDALGRAVSQGRRAEFERFAAFQSPAARSAIPDPNDPRTFEKSKLCWEERSRPPHAERLELIGRLLALRHRHLVPRLAGSMRGGAYRSSRGLLRVEWMLGDGTPWHLIANLDTATAKTGAPPEGATVYQSGIATLPDGTLEIDRGGVLVIGVAAQMAPMLPVTGSTMPVM
jgi:maltooligosyltrehalose trehalohydrolase